MTTVIDFLVPGLSIDRAVVEKLGWTLVLFLWQGAVIAVVLALLDALLARHRATLRYACGCTALLAMLAAPIATFAVLSSSGSASAPHHVAGVSEISRPSPATFDLSGLQRARRAPAMMADNAAARSGRLAFAARLSAARLLPWVVALWGLGVLMLSLRLLGGWWMVRRLARSAEHIALDGWQANVDRLVRRFGVARSIRLMRSAWVSVPTTIGWLRPLILLPASTLTGLLPNQIEAILAHELAHIRRHDYLVNLLQSLLETLLFYHPAVWWVSHRIRDERELCCDELAVEASGDPIVYARALVELERLRGEDFHLALAASGGSLVDRIARLLGVSRRPHRIVRRGLAWALVAAVVLIGGAAGGAVRVNGRPLAAVPAKAVREVANAAVRLAPSVAATGAATVVHQAAVLAAVATSVVEATTPEPEIACDGTPPGEASRESACNGTEDIGATPEDVPETPDAAVDVAAARRYSEAVWLRLEQAGVSPRYVANLERNGYSSLTAEELMALAQHGVSSAYAGKMRRILGNPSVTELVELTNHGVSSEYAGKMKRIFGEISVAELVELANHGVSSSYTSAMRTNDGDLRVADLVQLASHGISSDYLTGLRELGLEDLSTDDLIRLANSGVTLDWFAAMRWMGYRDISVERAIELHNEGVTPDFAASLRILQKHPLSLDELRALRNQGIDVDYAASMMGMFRKDLDVEQLIRLHNQGVTVEFVAAMNAMGRSNLSCDDLIMLQQQGIDPDYLASLAGAGYQDLEVRDLVRLRQNGVDADFIESVRDAGFKTPSVKELIRMRQTGIPEEHGRP